MLSIDETRLNKTERTALKALSAHAMDHPSPTIVEAATICGCSASLISKAVKKAGFPGYKQYLRFLYHQDVPTSRTLDEIERLKRVLAEFKPELAEELAGLITGHRKIILFGYGPSMLCAQYVEYKLRFRTRAFVATAPDEQSVLNMVDTGTLLIIITATGAFRSFEALSRRTRDRGADVVVVSEELNPRLSELGGRYICLSNHKQPDELLPHEKTRTVFFIFFEQVIRRILAEAQAGVTPAE